MFAAHHRRFLSLERLIGALLGIGAVVLAGLLILTHLQFQQMDEGVRQATASRQRLDAFEDLTKTLVEAEADQRGFMLTSRESDLSHYRERIRLATMRLSVIERAFDDDSVQQPRIVQMVRLTREKLSELDRTVAYQPHQPEIALAIVRGGEGTRLMAGLHQVVQEITDYETAQLANRQAMAGQARDRAERLAGAAVVVLTLTFTGSFIAVRRELKKRAALTRELAANQATLLKTERWLRALTDNLPAVISHFDEDQRYTFINEEFRRQCSRDPASVIGKTLREVNGDEVHVQIGSHLDAAARGEACEFELHARVGGQDKWLQQNLIPDRNAEGTVQGCYSVSFDITERKRQEQALKKSQFLLDRASRLAGIGSWEANLVTGQIYWSDEACRIHGVADGHLPKLDEALGSYVPQARAVLEQAVHRAITTGEPWNLELALELTRADGKQAWVRIVGSIEFEASRPVRLLGALQDITERVHQQVRLEQLAADLDAERLQLSVTLRSIGDAVITTDDNSVVTWLNPVAERLTGWTTAEARGQPLSEVFRIVNEETRAPVPNPVATCLAHGEIVGASCPTVLLSRDGRDHGIEESAAPIRSEHGVVLGVVLVFRDVSEQRRLSSEMSYRATHDALTGLINRAEFETRLQRVLDRAREDGSENTLLYIDLDQFKLVNDACGHAVGDQLLQQMAKLLAESVRAHDTLARLGGDEFAIILEHCPADQAQRVAQKICDRMDDYRFQHDERRFRIGTSIGLVPVDKRWAGTAAIQQAADTSCYAAKEAGRNRVHAWFDTDSAMHDRHNEMQWTTRIEKALDEDGFVLFAQRIEPLRPGRHGLHAEVLLRLHQADGSLASPGAFLPSAERFHLISRIDRWVFKRVVAWLQALPPATPIDLLSVNLSGQSVGDRSFHRWALELLTSAGPAICNRLCIEITETAAVTNMADAARFIDDVRKVGVKVALDDFGAGASSFGYLKNLRIDFLKIDGQFVRDMFDDPLDEAAVRCFVDVAKVVGVKTVAEFVDKPAVLHQLKGMGVDFAQGFLLHKPAPIGELLASAIEAAEPTLLLA